MSTMKIKLSSNESSVRLISLNKDRTHAACYLSNLLIPIVDTNTGAIIHKYDVSNQMVGMHYQPESDNVLYAVDDSFGLHAFDTRTQTKSKTRINPERENHEATATALSGENVVAVASSSLGCISSQQTHLVSLFDIRCTQKPFTTYGKKHNASITSMDYNQNTLITGDTWGGVKVYDTNFCTDEKACCFETYLNNSVTRMGFVNRNTFFAIGHEQEVNVFIDVKNKVEILYGGVRNAISDSYVEGPCHFNGPEWVTGVIIGPSGEVPLVAVHGTEGDSILSLTGLERDGNRKKMPFYTYPGHNGQIIAFRADKTRIFTGGADGHLIIQPFEFDMFDGPSTTNGDVNSDDEIRCAICLEAPIDPKSCKHCNQTVGCKRCIKKWCRTTLRNQEAAQCPLCRGSW